MAALAAAPALSKESEDRAMNQTRQTIDALVERIQNAKPTKDEIAHILGSPKFEKSGAATVTIDRPPFQSAYVEEYRRVIKIRFTMSAGTWQLKDITEDVSGWLLGPALPDSGRMEAVRDWDLKNLEVRCITEVDGKGALGNQLVSNVRCQVTSE